MLETNSARSGESHESASGRAGGMAVHAIAVTDGEPPVWVQLLPAGVFMGRDGRGPYQVENAEEVIRATKARNGMDLPIDYGHALERDGHTGDSAPAAGWITDFQVRGGEIWGRVSWTRTGEASIRGKEFRFLSPVFYHRADGAVEWILRAGLTNRPNLQLQAIDTAAHSRPAAGGSEMEELRRISANLGLDPGSLAHAAAKQQRSARNAAGRDVPDGAALSAICAQLGISEEEYRRAHGA